MEPTRMKIRLVAFVGLVLLLVGVKANATDVTELFPSPEVFNKSFVKPTKDGNYELRMIGKKFAAVYTNTGRPVAIFDLSLSHLSLGRIILGGFMVKDLNWKGVRRYRKCSKKARKANRKFNDDKNVDPANLDDCHVKGEGEGTFEFWKDMKMSEEWAARNNKLDKGNPVDGYTFEHSSFDLSEFKPADRDTELAIQSPFKKLAETLYPASEWNEEAVKKFMKEFKMNYNKKDHSYQLVWDTSARKKKKGPKLPGFVANYVQPAANVIYRNNLLQIDQLGDITKYRFWPYGSLISMFVYRITDKLIDRLNYHESQFVGLLEAAERFEYDVKMPAQLTDLTLDLVYLSKSRPQHFRSGTELRKARRAYQEKARSKVMKRLNKSKEKKKVDVEVTGNGKWVVARYNEGEKKGQIKGIYNAGVKPHFLTRQVSMAVNAKTPAFKIAERFTLDAAGLLAKTYLKTYFRVPIPKINFVIQLPRDFWDRMVRQRMWKELNLEGELVGLLDEAIAGNLPMALSKEEAMFARKRLYSTYLNPYETHIKKEDAVIEKNLELLKKVLSGNTEVLFDEKHLVPFSL